VRQPRAGPRMTERVRTRRARHPKDSRARWARRSNPVRVPSPWKPGSVMPEESEERHDDRDGRCRPPLAEEALGPASAAASA